MDVYCPRCASSLTEIAPEAKALGVCPKCAGQLTSAPAGALQISGMVAMSFELGSRVGTPFEPGFLQSSLSETAEEGSAMSDGDSKGDDAEPGSTDDRRATIEMPAFNTSDMERRATSELPAFTDTPEPPSVPTIPDFPAFPAPPSADAAPEAAPAPAPPADDGIPAHLKLPSIDFSMPELPSFGAAGSSTTAAPSSDGTGPSGLPAGMDLPSFPKFDMSFDMKAPAAEQAPPADYVPAHLQTNTHVGPPPPPPPPPRRKAAAQQAVPQQTGPVFPNLPALGGLPDLAGPRRDVTLTKSAAAQEIASQLEKKSMLVPILVGFVLVIGAGVGWAVFNKDKVLAMTGGGAKAADSEESPAYRAKVLLAEGLKSQDAGLKTKAKKTSNEHFRDAITKYHGALLLDPKLARAHRELAVVYATTKDEERAIEHYRHYLELAPKAEDAAQVKKIIDDWEAAAAKKKDKKKKK